MAVEDTTVTAAPGGQAWGSLAACLLAVFVQMLDLTIVNTALPVLTRDLSATGTVQMFVVTGYGLAFACTLLTAARLGDRFGRRRLFLLGMTLFTAASLGCGLARTPLELVAGRAAQGVGAAAVAAQTIAILAAAFAPQRRPMIFGIYGAVAGLAGLAGPLLGGLIVSANPFEWGWRAIFLMNLPIGTAALVAAARYLRADGAGGISSQPDSAPPVGSPIPSPIGHRPENRQGQPVSITGHRQPAPDNNIRPAPRPARTAEAPRLPVRIRDTARRTPAGATPRWAEADDIAAWAQTGSITRRALADEIDRWTRACGVTHWAQAADVARWAQTHGTVRWSRADDPAPECDIEQPGRTETTRTTPVRTTDEAVGRPASNAAYSTSARSKTPRAEAFARGQSKAQQTEAFARGYVPIDWVGAGLSTTGLLAVLFPLTTGQQAGWPPMTVAVLVFGVVVLAGFAGQQRRVARRGGTPLVSAEVFGDRGFGIGSVLLLLFYGLFAALLLTVSVTAQSGLGFSAWETGRLMLPFALGALVAALTSPILLARCGSRALTIGIALFAVATAQMALTVHPSSGGIDTHALSVPILLAGAGMGWFAAPLPAVMVAGLGERSTGIASGLAPTVQQLGSAIGAAALGSVFFGGVATGSGVASAETVLTQHLAVSGTPADTGADAVGQFGRCAHAAFAAPEHTLAGRGCAATDAAVSAAATAPTYLSACVTVLWIIAAVASLLTALTLVLPRRPGAPR